MTLGGMSLPRTRKGGLDTLFGIKKKSGVRVTCGFD